MTESFEEFLKNKIIRRENGVWFGNKLRLYFIEQTIYPLPGSYIAITDLGNHAWENFLVLSGNPLFLIDENKDDWVNQLDMMVRSRRDELTVFFFDMALDCLGKKEIDKRLKQRVGK